MFHGFPSSGATHPERSRRTTPPSLHDIEDHPCCGSLAQLCPSVDVPLGSEPGPGSVLPGQSPAPGCPSPAERAPSPWGPPPRAGMAP